MPITATPANAPATNGANRRLGSTGPVRRYATRPANTPAAIVPVTLVTLHSHTCVCPNSA